MNQYLDLLNDIKRNGTYKPAAREGMPGTTSLFGYQFRHNLADGFPMLTTKKLSFKNIIVELLWFMNGDTNVKYLNDNGCFIWNEDAYNYYIKLCKVEGITDTYSFEEFESIFKGNAGILRPFPKDYIPGDCGKQYGWLWRKWGNDQLVELIKGLKSNPMGRRHIISAWNAETLDDMALNACHALVQFNCRPLSDEEKHEWILKQPSSKIMIAENNTTNVNYAIVPKYYLDCHMYQRSADVFLGVPYNIASYALLTEILAKLCGMVPGEYIHSFGDVHIYDDHMDAVDEQLSRTPTELPTLELDSNNVYDFRGDESFLIEQMCKNVEHMKGHWKELFHLNNYVAQPTIKAKLSTGLK